MEYTVTVSTFKDKPILKIKAKDYPYAMALGLKKAKIIVDNIEAIKKFLESPTQS